MRFAYADPPYLFQGKLYADQHPQARSWDNPARHARLVAELDDEYPDGWAMSASAPSLPVLLPMVTNGQPYRVAVWVKPFAAYKRNVRVAYTWEPVIVRGGRLSTKDGAQVTRDHLAEGIAMKRGLTGAKPERFCRWVLLLLGWTPGDEVVDLFPGTGVMGRVVAELEQTPSLLDGDATEQTTIDDALETAT